MTDKEKKYKQMIKTAQKKQADLAQNVQQLEMQTNHYKALIQQLAGRIQLLEELMEKNNKE